jgi:hypothetical protein
MPFFIADRVRLDHALVVDDGIDHRAGDRRRESDASFARVESNELFDQQRNPRRPHIPGGGKGEARASRTSSGCGAGDTPPRPPSARVPARWP